MRARVGHGVVNVVIRQMRILWIAVKGELKNAHTRKILGVAQVDHVRRDHAEIFGDKRQIAQFSLRS